MSATDSAGLKSIAVEFLRLVASGQVREAYRRCVAPGFRHHNAYFKGDAQSLMLAMEENAAKFPHKTFELQRALQEGNLVAVHSHVRLKPDDRGLALVHICRFEGERIAEFWDIAQPIPENCPNENGMF